jgi:prepilin-type N-terminal cleavage/methylation domain-containing protein
MTRRLTKHRQRGFTLLEVLIATTVLSTAVVALLGLHARNIRLAAEIHDVTVAGTLGSQVVASTRIRPFPELGLTKGEFRTEPEASLLFSDREESPYGGTEAPRFRWSREVTETAIENFRQVRIVVHRADNDHPLAELLFGMRQR